MRRIASSRLLPLASLLLAGPWCAAALADGLTVSDGLPPGEKYRQLMLLEQVAAGADDILVGVLDRAAGSVTPAADLGGALDAMSSSTSRIADPGAVLAGAAGALRLGSRLRKEIGAELARLRGEHPLLTRLVQPEQVFEDVMLIRAAITDTLFTLPAPGKDAQFAASLRAYEQATLRLRNDAEFKDFKSELDQVLGMALEDLDGSLEAHRRMVESEQDSGSVLAAARSAQEMSDSDSVEHRLAKGRLKTQSLYQSLLPALSQQNQQIVFQVLGLRGYP